MSNNTILELYDLTGKVALVVGGAGYLGSAISEAFLEQGATVIIASRDKKKSEHFIKLSSKKFPKATIIFLALDIADQTSIAKFKDKFVNSTHKQLDILVNCGWSGRKNTLESISDDDWDFDIETCLSGVFRLTKTLLPYLKSSKGCVLSISSMYGHVAPDPAIYDGDSGLANPPSYGAAKAGVIQLTKYLASFLSKDGIRVNCISPGPFPFPEVAAANPAFISRLSDKTLVNRVGFPHEIKGAALLLCSEAGSFINGQNLCVDGGWGLR